MANWKTKVNFRDLLEDFDTSADEIEEIKTSSIDIILLAMIAGFIFLRLRGILGKRTGFEGKAPQFEKILKNNDFKLVRKKPNYFEYNNNLNQTLKYFINICNDY